MKKKLILPIIIVAVLAIAAIGYFVVMPKMQSKTVYASTFSVVTAERSAIKSVITGSGNVKASNKSTVFLDKSGTVQGLTLEEGDEVSRGQVLFTLDNDSLQKDLDQMLSDKKQQDINISKMSDQLVNSKIYASRDGRIVNLQAQAGENAALLSQTYGQLMTIDVLDVLNVVANIDYNSQSIRPKIYLGMEVFVRQRGNQGKKYPGTIISISGDRYIIEIARGTIPDSGAMVIYKSGDDFVYDIIGYGQSEFVKPVSVTGTGIIKKVYVSNEQMVKRGDLLIEFETKEIDKSIAAGNVARERLNERINERKDDIADNAVVAPIAGVLQILTVSEGEQATVGRNVATIVDIKSLEVAVDIDELDIPRVKAGQSVKVTVDALMGKEFAGKVKKISPFGTVMNGVTNYSVTVEIQSAEGIYPGMSATANIITDQIDDALLLSATAIIKKEGRSYVRVLKNGVNLSDRSTYANGSPYDLREVQVGLIQNGEAHILSGIDEKDQILLDTNNTPVGT